MANSPAIEYFIAQIANLQKLIENIDGVQPILISIGEYKLPVDPIQFPPAYQAGSAVIRSVALGAINDYKSHISDAILAEALAPTPTETPTEDPGSSETPSEGTTTGTESGGSTEATGDGTSTPLTATITATYGESTDTTTNTVTVSLPPSGETPSAE